MNCYELKNYCRTALPLAVWRELPQPLYQPEHRHDCVEMVFVEHGAGWCAVNGCRYPMLRGDLYVMSESDRHAFSCDRGFVFFNIMFSRDLLTAELAVTAEGEPRPLPPAEAEDSSREETPSLPETAVSIAEEQADSSSQAESLPAQDSSVTESSSVPDDGGLARLKSLTVSAGKLKPDFSPDVFEYEVTVPPETEYISVDAELKDRYDTIWYEGSEYLGIGMTPWTITVTTPDGTVSHAYFIRVNRHTADYSEPEEESSEVQALTEVSSSEVLEKLEEDNVTRRSVSQTPAPHEEKVTLREKITPILIIAVCVIIAAVGIIVLRIRSRSNNSFRK